MASIIKNPTSEATKIVFGDIELLNIHALSKKTGIPSSTLYRNNFDVGLLSAERFAKICKARGLSDADIIKAVRLMAKDVI